MTLPPQEPPRGPPPLKVSQKSHKIKKQPPRSSAGPSQSHHPPAPPPWEDHLASLEQQLMSDDGLEEMPQLPDELLHMENLLMQPPNPPEAVPTMTDTERLIAFLRADSELQREPFLKQRRRRRKEREEMQQQNPLPTIPPEVVSTVADTQTVPSLNELGSASNILPNQPVNFPPAPTAAATRFLPRTPESFPAGASTFFPNPPPPDYLPPTPAAAAAAASSFLPNPPPRMFPDTPSRSIPGPWRNLSPPVARHSILQGPPGNFRPAATGSLPYIPPPAVAGGSSIWYGPPGYFPDNSSSFFLPLPLSEYSPSASSSAASLPPESSLDGSFSPDSTKQPPPPPPDPSA